MSDVDRKPGHSIKPEFYQRWSPRAFSAEEISAEALMRGFEAARWSPSGGNSQPWRFIYALRGTPAFDTLSGFLVEGNRSWAKNAAALIVILAKKDFEMGGKWMESSSYSFDSGAAWVSFALQMQADGWRTHAMAGIDRDKVRRDFALPENFSVEHAIAVGRQGDKDALPEPLRGREVASQRKPLESIVSEGGVPATWL